MHKEMSAELVREKTLNRTARLKAKWRYYQLQARLERDREQAAKKKKTAEPTVVPTAEPTAVPTAEPTASRDRSANTTAQEPTTQRKRPFEGTVLIIVVRGTAALEICLHRWKGRGMLH